VIKKKYKPGSAKTDPIHGRFSTEIEGKSVVVEYETDTGLRDLEQIPLLKKGGIAAFFSHEVLSHVSDAWIYGSAVKTGYKISFTRYFYKSKPLMKFKEIRADTVKLEKETEGLLGKILQEYSVE
jgi:type I restriction enzyme M protein